MIASLFSHSDNNMKLNAFCAQDAEFLNVEWRAT
jgi:hypothetical protein